MKAETLQHCSCSSSRLCPRARCVHAVGGTGNDDAAAPCSPFCTTKSTKSAIRSSVLAPGPMFCTCCMHGLQAAGCRRWRLDWTVLAGVGDADDVCSAATLDPDRARRPPCTASRQPGVICYVVGGGADAAHGNHAAANGLVWGLSHWHLRWSVLTAAAANAGDVTGGNATLHWLVQ